MLDPGIAVALLASGGGARFGSGKLRAELGGRPLWRWAAAAAEDAGFAARHIVTNDAEIAREAGAAGWIVHPNPVAEEGIAASIRVAATAAAARNRLVLALADMPFVEPDLLTALALERRVAFTRQRDGRDGVPAGFPRATFAELLTLAGDRGAGALYWAGRMTCTPETFDSLLDIDTPEDLARAETLAIKRARAVPR